MHTDTTLAFFLYFAHVWLLMQVCKPFSALQLQTLLNYCKLL